MITRDFAAEYQAIAHDYAYGLLTFEQFKKKVEMLETVEIVTAMVNQEAECEHDWRRDRCGDYVCDGCGAEKGADGDGPED